MLYGYGRINVREALLGPVKPNRYGAARVPVTGRSGRRYAGCAVTLKSLEGNFKAVVRSNNEGWASFYDIPAGQYEAWWMADGSLVSKRITVAPGEQPAQ